MSTQHHTPFNVGDLLTAQALNSRLSALDSAISVTGSFCGMRAIAQTNTTVEDPNDNALVRFDVQVFDTDAFFDPAVDTTTITIPAGKAGYYAIAYTLDVERGSSDPGTISLQLLLTGQSGTQQLHRQTPNALNETLLVSHMQVASLAAGDAVQLNAARGVAGGSFTLLNAEISLWRVG